MKSILSERVEVAGRIRIDLGAIPPKGAVIIVSTDADGTPGGLKSHILGPLGLDDERMPTTEALHRGYAVVRSPTFPGIVGFVVTVGDGDVAEATTRNLLSCLTDSQIASRSHVWIPLIGTGAGRLDLPQSLSGPFCRLLLTLTFWIGKPRGLQLQRQRAFQGLSSII